MKNKICTQLTMDEHEQIQTQLLQLKGIVGLILIATHPNSDYENKNINSSAWLISDMIEQIRSKLDEAVAGE